MSVGGAVLIAEPPGRVLSGIIIILTALYVAATILLFGVVVNALVADEGTQKGVSE